MSLSGSCLCGGVRYEVEDIEGEIVHRHCQTCGKAHAAAHATTARVRRDRFRWIAGRELVRGLISSPGKTRHFCGSCGTHLVAERDGQDQVILRVGSLDDDPGKRPVAHIWTSQDEPWLKTEVCRRSKSGQALDKAGRAIGAARRPKKDLQTRSATSSTGRLFILGCGPTCDGESAG